MKQPELPIDPPTDRPVDSEAAAAARADIACGQQKDDVAADHECACEQMEKAIGTILIWICWLNIDKDRKETIRRMISEFRETIRKM